ncbi:MAG: sulfotransferase [Bacteroidales bacterium]|nr:sulfotransferase [Bacteroidales bacterium]
MNDLIAKEILDLPFFFVIGRPRTGTTLIRTLLDVHPNAMIPPEAPIILQFFGKYGRVSDWSKEKLLEFYDDLMKEQEWVFLSIGNWPMDRDKLKRDLLACEGKNTYANICKIVNGNYKPYVDKDLVILGDKNPAYANKTKYLLKLYPDAKFVLIYRDHRDHIQSMNKVDFGNTIVPINAYRWRKYVRINQKLTAKYPDRFFSFRYEDFVANPKSYFRDMCDFLGIEHNDEVFEFYKLKEKVRGSENLEMLEKYHSSLFRPISTKNVGNWKETLTDDQVLMADAVVGKYAERAGYERKFKRPGFKLKLKLFPIIVYLKVTDWIGELMMKYVDYDRFAKFLNRGPVFGLKYWKMVSSKS